MKYNDRLQRVQVDRHTDVPLQSVWYLVITEYDEPSWDSATSLGELKAILDANKWEAQVFAVWHGQWRTNLFLMPLDYIKTSLQNSNNVKQKASK